MGSILQWWRDRQAKIASTYMRDVTQEDIARLSDVEKYYMRKANEMCYRKGMAQKEFRRSARWMLPTLCCISGSICILCSDL